VTRGYVKFFEPDAYVEAEEGLLEEAGLGPYRSKHRIFPQVVPLSEFLSDRDRRGWQEPSFGLPIIDAMSEVYQEEQRFQLRQPRASLLVKSITGSAISEAVFGVYPTAKKIAYVRKSYENVFEPDVLSPGAAAWRKAFIEGALTPLRLTRHKLPVQRGWQDDAVLFVFNPTSPFDLIDLWNLRLEPKPVLALPLDWWNELRGEVRTILKQEHRPLRGNPHGVMHRATIEFARSIPEEKVERAVEALGGGLPPGSVSLKHWRTPVWKPVVEEGQRRLRRLEVTAVERRVDLPIEEGTRLSTRFSAIAPEFAEKYAHGEPRWMNVLSISSSEVENVGLVIPFNTFDPEWPARTIDAQFAVGSVGWSMGQRYKDWTQHLDLLSPEDALIGSLKRSGVEALLSEPGHIAKQVLGHLGGLRGLSLLQDEETLAMLNAMAGGIRRNGRDEESEQLFDRRSKSVKDWQDLLARRRACRRWHRAELQDFTDRGVIKLGLQTTCPTCHGVNWHSLTAVDYSVSCDRCQKIYSFPQAALDKQNGNWRYRVVGPFAVPDYARGSYGALLALNVLRTLSWSSSRMTYSTAMTLKLGGADVEADFAAWWSADRFDEYQAPELVFGEAKSFGQGDLIKQSDITKLRLLAQRFPGATMVVSVLRRHFTENEKALLTTFVKWCRRPDAVGRSMNPVVLLTGHELFFDFSIDSTWKTMGEPHRKFGDSQNTRSLGRFADATQAIYLGLPPYSEEVRQRWRRRQERRLKSEPPPETLEP
jgi:hypothetical protein